MAFLQSSLLRGIPDHDFNVQFGLVRMLIAKQIYPLSRIWRKGAFSPSRTHGKRRCGFQAPKDIVEEDSCLDLGHNISGFIWGVRMKSRIEFKADQTGPEIQ